MTSTNQAHHPGAPLWLWERTCHFLNLRFAIRFLPGWDDSQSRAFIAFSTPQGHFQLKLMPFWLINSPITFSRLMDITMGNSFPIPQRSKSRYFLLEFFFTKVVWCRFDHQCITFTLFFSPVCHCTCYHYSLFSIFLCILIFIYVKASIGPYFTAIIICVCISLYVSYYASFRHLP